MKEAKRSGTVSEKIVLPMFVLCVAMLITACQPQGSGFLKNEFMTFHRVAISPFEGDPGGEICQSFYFSFRERFPQMDILDQYRLMQTSQRESLYPNRLSEVTRSRIYKELGAQAVIVGNVISPGIGNWYLQVKVIDTRTGETLGASSVQTQDIGGRSLTAAVQLAVEKLALRE